MHGSTQQQQNTTSVHVHVPTNPTGIPHRVRQLTLSSWLSRRRSTPDVLHAHPCVHWRNGAVGHERLNHQQQKSNEEDGSRRSFQ